MKEENVTVQAFYSKATFNKKRRFRRIVLKIPEKMNKEATIKVLVIPEVNEALLAVPEKGIRKHLRRNELQLADRIYGASKYFRLSMF